MDNFNEEIKERLVYEILECTIWFLIGFFLVSIIKKHVIF